LLAARFRGALALNTCRAAEEAAGLIRWLRPSFQDPARRAAASAGAGSTAVAGQQNPLNLPAADVVAVEAEALDVASVPAAKAAPISRMPWPADNKEQFRSVADLLAASHVALTEAQIVVVSAWCPIEQT
jgi:hypothetical protein